MGIKTENHIFCGGPLKRLFARTGTACRTMEKHRLIHQRVGGGFAQHPKKGLAAVKMSKSAKCFGHAGR